MSSPDSGLRRSDGEAVEIGRSGLNATRAMFLDAAVAKLCALASVVGVAAMLGFGGSEPLRAQGLDQGARSYITPFPEGNRYRFAVFGDSLANGLGDGLVRLLDDERDLEVVNHARPGTGFSRIDQFDWNAHLNSLLDSEGVHIAVVMVGASDMRAIHVDGQWREPGTEEWREAYGARIERFVTRLKDARAAVYWVGLPIVRSDSHNQTMRTMNEVFREKAFINGIKFIDTWNGFADEFGRYSAYGPDVTGQMRRLRAEDGIHFTTSGYVKLAHFVETEVGRDLRIARSERNVPLAGSQEEQARIVRRPEAAAIPAPAEQTAQRADVEPAGDDEDERRADARLQPPGAPAPDLALPLVVDMAVSAAGSGYAPPGETIAHDMGNGLTALASISPINDPRLGLQQQLPPTQRPFYRVLIEGEHLKPKIGRADDFSVPDG